MTGKIAKYSSFAAAIILMIQYPVNAANKAGYIHWYAQRSFLSPYPTVFSIVPDNVSSLKVQWTGLGAIDGKCYLGKLNVMDRLPPAKWSQESKIEAEIDGQYGKGVAKLTAAGKAKKTDTKNGQLPAVWTFAGPATIKEFHYKVIASDGWTSGWMSGENDCTRQSDKSIK